MNQLLLTKGSSVNGGGCDNCRKMGFKRLLFHCYENKKNNTETTDRNDVSAFRKRKVGEVGKEETDD